MEAGDATAVLARARHGDSDAFQTLVERHGRAAFLVAFRLTGNHQDAEEVVQDSFLKAYRRLEHFEARANFGTWLHRIVVNSAMDLLRARRSRQRFVDDAADAQTVQVPAPGPWPERLAQGAEIVRSLEASLALLTPLERVAFTERHGEGRSIDEIGRTLGLGRSAVKHAVFRAVKKLRVALQPHRSTR